MGVSTPLPPRLHLKRVFSQYYRQVCTLSVADPTDVFAACERYLALREKTLGRPLSEQELEEEMWRLGGEIEQDLIRKGPEFKEMVVRESVPTRLKECMTVARRRREAGEGVSQES